MPDDISNEDRERLARAKFGEWFDEFFNEKFAEAFDKRVVDTHKAAGTSAQPAPQQQQASHPAHTRRSLFDISLEQALGIR
jgi:hypothetical protein